MGANIIHVGDIGAGEVAKLCNNLIAGVAFVAVSEAFRIAEGFGVDLKVLTQVIAKSSGATWVMEKNHPVPGIDPNSAASRDYAPGFMTDLMAKDLGLAVNAARDKRVPVSVAAAAQQIYRMASAHGLGARPRPQGLRRGLPVPHPVIGRCAGVIFPSPPFRGRGRAPSRSDGRVRWVSAIALESPTSPQPSPPRPSD